MRLSHPKQFNFIGDTKRRPRGSSNPRLSAKEYKTFEKELTQKISKYIIISYVKVLHHVKYKKEGNNDNMYTNENVQELHKTNISPINHCKLRTFRRQ